MNILPFDTPTFGITIAVPQTTVAVRTPTKSDYYRMVACLDKKAMAEYILERYGTGVAVPFSMVTGAAFVADFVKALDDYREVNMDIMRIPEQIDFKSIGKEIKLPCITSGERLVYEHSGLDFIRQGELPVTEYWVLLADAMKMLIMKRTDGEEYLAECYNDMHRINTL